MLKRILCLFLSFLLILPFFTGCDSTKDAYIYFELPETPSTLDPQTASSDSELLIIKNVFEGLLRKNEKGEIVCGAAEDFSKSGLTYTFKIRKDAKWSSGEELTAYDFEYGLKRAVLPETKAPFVSRLYSIKGAKEINTESASVSTLGVKAVDSYTLTITLNREDSHFENTLTTSVAMPCNRIFFDECAGKYGLFADKILSNGSYRLARWRKDPFGVRLYRNKEYNGDFESENAAVFLTCDKDETPFQRLEKNSVDMAFIEAPQKSQAKNSGLKTVDFENICWVLTIGNQFNSKTRESLSMFIGSEVFEDSLSEGYKSATSIFPSIFGDNVSSEGVPVYNPEKAKTIYLSQISSFENSKFPEDAVLYYYDDGYVKDVVTDVVGHWQGNISAFVNIESASDSSLLLPQLVDKSYAFAVFPIKAESCEVAEYLKKFGYDYENQPLETVQKELLKGHNIVPLMFQNTTIGYSSALSNVVTEYGNGYVDFAFIVKEED